MFSKNIKRLKPHTNEQYEQAVALVRGGMKPNTTALRAALSIGSSKAVRILDKMEQRGVIEMVNNKRQLKEVKQ